MTPSPEFPPARGYRWPDATSGNLIALRHGMRSPRVYGPVAEKVREELLATIETEEATFLMDRPTFKYALEALITTIARVRVGRQHLVEKHDTGECERESCLNQLAILEREHDRRLDAMGLTARSRATIQSALSQTARNVSDISTLIEQGRAIREARENAQESPGSTNGDDAA